MKKTILCFGDSNTHGYCSETGGSILTIDTDMRKGNEKEEYVQPLKRENGSPAERPFKERRAEGSFGAGRRLLEKYLGDGYIVREEGLSGRTTVFEDPLFEGLCGLSAIFG